MGEHKISAVRQLANITTELWREAEKDCQTAQRHIGELLPLAKSYLAQFDSEHPDYHAMVTAVAEAETYLRESREIEDAA